MADIHQIAKEARIKVLDLIFQAQTSHIGSNFSCIDILTVLFEKMDLEKDIFVLSAGWKAASLYYFMWRKGLITEQELNSYCQPGSKWIGLSEPVHPFIKFAGGSMGMGLPAAVGFALAKKMKNEEGKVYCLMSDGEMQIGAVWESALIASQYQLDNLYVLIDANGLQAMGRVEEILDIESPEDKWDAFNWDVNTVNGHNAEKIKKVLELEGNKPYALICKTVKGKGVSFMENNNLYHYKAPSRDEYESALKELNL